MATDPCSLLDEILPPRWYDEAALALGLAPDGAPLYRRAAVCRLMVWQRVQGGASMREAVAALLAPGPEGGGSPATGGYSRARSRLPAALAREASDAVLERLGGGTPGDWLLDGTSFRAPAEPPVSRAFPPAANQHGRSHWPQVKAVAAVRLDTGLCARPEHGPMHGPGAVSEQALASRLLRRLPPGSRVVGDRNFGVFQTVWDCRRAGLVPLVRLTLARARSLCPPLPWGTQPRVVWKPSRADRQGRPDLPADAAVEGRLILRRLVRKGRVVELALFTTDLGGDPEEAAQTYGRRWEVETDLRSLKATLAAECLSARSPEVLEKELALASAAVNLVRSLMAEAAKEAGLEPRRLSFCGALALVRAFGAPGGSLGPEAARRFMRLLAKQRLYDRRGRASPERAVWPRPRPYPLRKAAAPETEGSSSM